MTGLPRVASPAVLAARYDRNYAMALQEKKQTPRKRTPARDKIIAKQRAHLEDIAKQAGRFRGPCSTCRWRKDEANCANPAVAKGKLDPTTGDISWRYPRPRNERQEEYATCGWREEGFEGPTLCGPEGKLWEPRTLQQVLIRWLLGGLNLLWIYALIGMGTGIVLAAIYGPPNG